MCLACEYAIRWAANVVIKFGTRKAPQGASLEGFSILHAIQQRAPQPISLRRSTHVLSFFYFLPGETRFHAFCQKRRRSTAASVFASRSCHRQSERAARAWHSRRPSPHRLECAGAVRERARARVPMQSPRGRLRKRRALLRPRTQQRQRAAMTPCQTLQHSAQRRPHETIRTVRQEKARGIALPIDIFGQRRLDLPILRQIPMLHSFFLPPRANTCSLNQHNIQNTCLASVLMRRSAKSAAREHQRWKHALRGSKIPYRQE